MDTSVNAFNHAHQLGDPATRPIAGLPGRLAALLFLAGSGHARHRAPARGMPDSYALKRYDSATLPDNPAGPHSDAFNRGFKVHAGSSWIQACIVVSGCAKGNDREKRAGRIRPIRKAMAGEVGRECPMRWLVEF